MDCHGGSSFAETWMLLRTDIEAIDQRHARAEFRRMSRQVELVIAHHRAFGLCAACSDVG